MSKEERKLSLRNRADLLERLTSARAILGSYNQYSDWSFLVSDKQYFKAWKALGEALDALEWHRRDLR